MPEKREYQKIADTTGQPYLNIVLDNVNDHVVRMSIMTGPYPWHLHPDSDETFIGVEGTVLIETPEGVLELTPGSSITIPRHLPHRTRPKDERSVNLTVERRDMRTEFIGSEAAG
ncbi:MAG TPA: cupin domain-containing protein [Puia sp.]|jgi:mannose-6-phosphate isomerase-like protein (cupin superfamily)